MAASGMNLRSGRVLLPLGAPPAPAPPPPAAPGPVPAAPPPAAMEPAGPPQPWPPLPLPQAGPAPVPVFPPAPPPVYLAPVPPGPIINAVPGPPPPPPPPPAVPPANLFEQLVLFPYPARMMILRHLFRGQPRMNLEGLARPPDLNTIYLLGDPQLYADAEEAFLSESKFEVWVLTSGEQSHHIHKYVDFGLNAPGTLVPPAQRWGTIQQIRQRTAQAALLVPSLQSPSWGRNSYYRVWRSGGVFPWTTCNQWLQNAGPFFRDVDIRVIYPLRSYHPSSPLTRPGRLEWNHLMHGYFKLRINSGPGAITGHTSTSMIFPPAPFPPAPMPLGMMLSPLNHGPGQTYPFWPANNAAFAQQCVRAGQESLRLRATYLPAAPPAGSLNANFQT
ncbi:hypothetical protein DHEL01_v206536 [Diaporthe helianthi]|uniref:Uncharacterized protein n=1 Tax=Diaporthe helianthi TaxID=158607 RepID=A0A2P5HXV7_DIAHE|nr:hypothetical protein DHEL01_v206536 [Diaporthe helianthi]